MSVVDVMLKTVALWYLSQCLLFSCSASANSSPPVNYDLPDNIVPLSYKIKLMPDMDSDIFTFSGKSEININVKKPATVITLHAKNLNIDDAIELNCRQYDNPSELYIFTVLNNSIDTKTDFLKIDLHDEIPMNSNCNLTLTYSSIENNDTAIDGFYENVYSENGTTKRIVSTLFQSISARKAFPCWDEPALKAYFSISIKHKTKYVALSNMHIVEIEKDGNDPTQVTTHFAQTPKMSTYLVAIVVGDLIPAVDNDNAKLRLWTRRNINCDGEYIQRIGLKTLDFLENYLNFPYEAQGFKKIDMVVIPAIESSGMENWGLIVCQESAFALTENSRSISQKEWMVTIITHELAHQWFGNLVTMSRWNYLWLNEGFATYLANIITDKIEPTWFMKDRFAIEIVQQNVMEFDFKNGTDAIEYQWNGRDNILTTGIQLNYQKSPTILRMISHVIGEEKFQAALRHYIEVQAFKSVTSKDLYRELSGGDDALIGFMENWITQPGYPLITVTRDYENEKATITQSRFFFESHDMSEERYWIPLNFVTEDKLDFHDTKVSHWFHPSNNSVEICELKKNEFVIFNKQQFGLYRVNYDEKNWQLIARYLKTKNHNDIHVINRAQLINDAFTLAKNNKLQYNIVLSLMAYLEKETDYIVWATAFSVISDIRTLLEYTEFAKPFKHYSRKLMNNLFEYIQTVKYDEDDHVMRLNRINILQNACLLKTQLCKSETSKIVDRWLKNPEEVTFSTDEKNWVIYYGVENDNQEAWAKLWKSNSDFYALALAYTSNVTFFEKYLLEIMSHNSITFEDLQLYLMDSVNDPFIMNAMLNFAIKHHNKIIELYEHSNVKENYIISLANLLKTKKQRKKLMELFESSKNFSANEINMALQLVDRNIKNFNEQFSKRSSEFKQFFDELMFEENPDV